jgi:hypothetical protein
MLDALLPVTQFVAFDSRSLSTEPCTAGLAKTWHCTSYCGNPYMYVGSELTVTPQGLCGVVRARMCVCWFHKVCVVW